MRCFYTLIGLTAAAVVAGVGILYSGVVDVGATQPHHALTRWLLHTGMKESVRHHAEGIAVPPLYDPQMVMEGFRHYREMCVGCHLAPGVKDSEIRQGLMPRPPRLQLAAERWKPAELFWIVKHGVRMTAMPAWGVTHSDDKIWAIVAFLEKLPGMTASRYQEMDKEAGHGHGDDHHADGHADGHGGDKG
jgi:mono/diheme cytochrome c family protein